MTANQKITTISRGGEGAEELGGLAGEVEEAQEDLKGKESKEVAVESSSLKGKSHRNRSH